MSQSLLIRTLEDHKVRQTPHRSTYVLPIFILKELGITRWSRQRPPAPERVEEIAAWIREHQDVVGTISLAWHPTERLVCYDGQHRLDALFQQEHVDITALVEIMWDTTELAIMAAFQTINRAVPVSELYTDPHDVLHSIKGEISDYVAGLATTYKAFLSTSAKPCRPNFNRDQLTEDLFHMSIGWLRVSLGSIKHMTKTRTPFQKRGPVRNSLRSTRSAHSITCGCLPRQGDCVWMI
jgi:hypothetical protein